MIWTKPGLSEFIKDLLKKYKLPFTDPCDPTYTGDCCVETLPPIVGTGDILVTGSYSTGYEINYVTPQDTDEISTCDDVVNCLCLTEPLDCTLLTK